MLLFLEHFNTSMAVFSVYQDSYIGATIISNRFIDEYMTEANDAQLKVYLYLVRMLNAHLETDISDIADRFNHTEKDVMRALKYWEKKGLLTLDYDDAKELCAVRLCNLCRGESKGPTVEETHSPARKSSHTRASSERSSAAPVANEVPVAEPISSAPSSAEISQQQLTTFAQNENAAQLIFVAEQYYHRQLTMADIKLLYFVTEDLSFSEDLTDYLMQYCAERGTTDPKYMEKVAIAWSEKQVTTPEEARAAAARYDRSVYTIMNQLGKSNRPTEKEMEYIKRWTMEWEFPQEVILEACNRTVMATDSHRFQYADGILSNWAQKNVRSAEDISRLDKEHQTRAAASKSASASDRASESGNTRRGGSAGAFGVFPQSDINYDELKNRIFINK